MDIMKYDVNQKSLLEFPYSLENKATSGTNNREKEVEVIINGLKEYLGVDELLDHEIWKYINRLRLCCKQFLTLTCDNGCGKYKVGIGCNLAVCPVCGKKQYKRFISKYKDNFRSWRNPKHLTLTLKNLDKITIEDYKTLSYWWKRLRQELKRHGDKHNVKYEFTYGIWAFHNHNYGRGYHLHLHIVFDGTRIPQRLISRLWERITKGSKIVEIHEIITTKQLSKAIQYVGNYVVKGGGSEATVHTLLEMFFASRNVRKYNTFGKLRVEMKRAKLTSICPFCGAVMVFDGIFMKFELEFTRKPFFKPIFKLRAQPETQLNINHFTSTNNADTA